MMRRAMQMFADMVNEKGGLHVGGMRYAVHFSWVSDGSSIPQVANATAHVIRDHDADYIIGPFSSGMTKYARKGPHGV